MAIIKSCCALTVVSSLLDTTKPNYDKPPVKVVTISSTDFISIFSWRHESKSHTPMESYWEPIPWKFLPNHET